MPLFLVDRARTMSVYALPNWELDGRDWPNRASSEFVSAGGLRWHVQRMGQGPVLLMLHGTGAATHSWRDFAPILAEHFTLIAPDLPGHGFTSAPPYERMSLPGMAGLIGSLVETLGVQPDLVLGHSAGAAILIRARLEGRIAPRGLISLNGALLPWRGLPGRLFSPPPSSSPPIRWSRAPSPGGLEIVASSSVWSTVQVRPWSRLVWTSISV